MSTGPRGFHLINNLLSATEAPWLQFAQLRFFASFSPATRLTWEIEMENHAN